MIGPLRLNVPPQAIEQYRYGARVLFESCLGWQVDVVPGTADAVELYWQDSLLLSSPGIGVGQDWRTQDLAIDMFTLADDHAKAQGWPDVLPGLVAKDLALSADADNRLLLVKDKHVVVNFDVVWTSFFLASGAWELKYGKVDQHQRVQGKDSWLVAHGFADKPVINYYAEAIFNAATALGSIDRVSRQYQRFVSCDVDRPFDPACYEPKRFVKRVARNVLIERRLGPLKQTLRTAYNVRKKGFAGDPNNTFDYLFDLNEKAGNTVRFFFMTESNTRYDAEYEISEPRITDLFRQITDRGHEIGLHGSFYSQFEDGRLGREKEALQAAMQACGAASTPISNRQHWLRWDVETSPARSEQAGISEDWTLGFDDWPGFRRSICVPYPMYDFATNTTLNVIERPLNVMECSLIGANHTVDADWEAIDKAYESCAQHVRRVQGEFHLLWHNHHLLTEPHRQLYEKLLCA